MTESLTDLEGFPRNDIDVYQVRHARHEINCLQNDLKDLLKAIEKGLEDVHAEGAHISSHKNPPEVVISDVLRPSNLRPFVIVNLVSPRSPAEEAVIFI